MPKISQLPAATNINLDDILPIVQGGVTKEISFTDMLKGPGGLDAILKLSQITNKTFAANDFFKFPDGPNGEPGLIIQWGFTTVSNVTFPVAFPNAVLNASATKGVNTNDSAVNTAEMAIGYVTETGMTVSAYKAGDITYQGVMWIAIGY